MNVSLTHINLTKTYNMKNLKLIIVALIFTAGLFTSCTPESIQDEQTPQQIDPWTVTPPRQG